MLPEPFNTILFLIVIPLAIQAYKLYREKGGNPLPRLAIQCISFVLAGVFVFVSGGFAGLDWPVWSGDAVAFVAQLLEVVGLAFGAITGLYEVVFKALFEKVGFA